MSLGTACKFYKEFVLFRSKQLIDSLFTGKVTKGFAITAQSGLPENFDPVTTTKIFETKLGMQEEGNKAVQTRLLVGAIDLGTTYSGWAFSTNSDYDRDPMAATVKHWRPGPGQLVTEKTPTCLLLRPDGTFLAFGYKAETEYIELVKSNKHRCYYIFRRFKMSLYSEHEQGLDYMTIKDEMGKTFSAKEVFAKSIKFLVDDMVDTVKKQIAGAFRQREVHFVLTVPAIWSNLAKQFMRECAIKSGSINAERLTLALEPEVASLYCRHLSIHATGDAETVSVSKFPKGSKHLVLDAGGGTIDIATFEVQDSSKIRLLTEASGGDSGGVMVDKAFESLFCDIFGRDVLEELKENKTGDWWDLACEIEMRKRATECTIDGKATFKFPSVMMELYTKNQNNKNATSLEQAIVSSAYGKHVEIKRDKLEIDRIIITNLFNGSMQLIVNYLQELMKEDSMKNVGTILMVGGYSESPLLQKTIEDAFPDKQVVIPRDASAAVLKGALIFGHNPRSIAGRVLKYTYGTDTVVPFEEGKHPKEKRFMSAKGYMCLNVFNKMIEKGQTVIPGQTQVEKTFKTVQECQDLIVLNLFASTEYNPRYVDDDGCVKIGNIHIYLEPSTQSSDRQVKLSMAFGDTEIAAHAIDCKTKSEIKVVLSFLG